MEELFTKIYQTKLWGGDDDTSGGGSTLEYNKDEYISFLKKFIIDNDIKSVVDLGCGDCVITRFIYDDLNVVYNGYDVYKQLIDKHSNNNIYDKNKYNFHHLDIHGNKEKIINADMCILKDVLQHWKTEEIYEFLDFLVDNKKFKYILICNCCNQEKDNQQTDGNHCRSLSYIFYPLKKYNITKLLNYNTKEISLITT